MRVKPLGCQGCSCEPHGSDFTEVSGQCSLGILIVGEASGEHEQREGRPFVEFAPAGGVLQRTLSRMGLSREQFAITNVLRCRPRGNFLVGAPWEYSSQQHCRPNLLATIAKYRPRVIVPLGGMALRAVTGLAGEYRGIEHLRGYPLQSLPDLGGGLVMPSFHPSHLRRGAIHLMGVLARDLHRATRLARGEQSDSYMWEPELHPERFAGYNLSPSIDDLNSIYLRLREQSGMKFTFDIETAETASLDEDARDQYSDTVMRLWQCCWAPGQAMAVPWENGYRSLVARIMKLPNRKSGHNVWLFDDKVMEAVGAREGMDLRPTWPVHDTMQMWHHWQPDLPANLQFCASFVNWPFPWKHLSGTNLQFYGCVDVDATYQLDTMLEGALRAEGLWGDGEAGGVRGYTGQVLRVRPVLDKMERHGLPVSEVERQRLSVEFEKVITAIHAEVQGMVPDELRRMEPRRGKASNYDYGYLREPKDTTGLVQRTFSMGALDNEGNPIIERVTRWVRLLDFNANSPDQLKAYMRFKGYKVPKLIGDDDPETGTARETTAKKQVLRLAKQTGDPLFARAIELKETIKAKGTYVEGFKPTARGVVHTTFTFDTAIGQLSCCAPWVPVRTSHGHKMIKDVKVGDLVWTHRGRWRLVCATWIHPEAPMVDVYLSNGYVLTCTTYHRVLISIHEPKQTMDDSEERGRSSETLSQSGCPHTPNNRGRAGDEHSNGVLHRQAGDTGGRVQSTSETSLLAVEGERTEPDVREVGGTSSQLEGINRRWARVSDLLSWEEARVRSSASDGSGTTPEGVASRDGSTSHQRRSERQPSGQPSSYYLCGSQGYPLAATRGFQEVAIEKVVAVGSFPVHDITVDEDESYESCGVLSHNSRQPNVQNFPKHGRLAKLLRRMVEARPGHVLTEWDFKSCHVLTLGYLAHDLTYIRLARIDMHSIMTGHFLKLWRVQDILCESDDQLRERCARLKANPEYKHVRDAKVKHAGLGIGNGLKYRGLYERYPEYFASQSEAKRILADYEEVFPKVFAWQKRTQKLAHDKQRLTTEFAHVRRFYEVYNWNSRKGDWGPGDQSEQAISYWLSNIAFGHIREKLLLLDASGMVDKYGLCNNVHDSFVFEVREDELAQHVADVGPVLRSPSTVLRDAEIAPDGLVIDVDLAVGRNWSEMQDYKVVAVGGGE